MIDAPRRRPFLISLGGLIALSAAATLLALNWQSLVTHIIDWQKVFHGLLATHVRQISQDPLSHGLALIGLSFAYGVFHAIGPGHGKAVIVTYLGSHKETLKRGMVISLLAALFQSVVAIGLVIVLAELLSIRFSDMNAYAEDITTGSYLLVMLLGAYLFFSAALRWIKGLRSQRDAALEHESGHAHGHEHHHHRHHHHNEPDHGEHGCCGGHHAHQVAPKESWLQSVGVILSMGIRPCAGAIVVLIYAKLVGAFAYGVIATLLMGLGTGLSIAGIALGTQLARQWFERRVYSRSARLVSHSGPWLRMTGGLVIFLLGLSLYQAASQTMPGHPLM